MRITGLLALLLFLLIVFAVPAASYAQTSSSDAARPAVTPASAPDFTRALRDFTRGDGTQLERDGVCYTMRTYVMARDDKDSDVTRMVRMTRCLSASRLEFKSAVTPVRRSTDTPAYVPE
ncbi:MAG TPA: hypothetical protein VLL05_20780 [Terriglobales bacterium]|nr:hypothetical protein [Terriglobales bacterium]